jgi:DNA-binding transcriptional ArsR family regulator
MKIEGLKDKNNDKDQGNDFVGKNFLLISLEEKKAKKIADAINSETARKILDHLSRKDSTESEMSKELGIPISTVHYNLKQLQEAHLVTVDEFHYSKKGKEVNHYSLANKYIIIAPKHDRSNFMEALKKVMPVAIITAGVAAIMQAFQSFGINLMANRNAVPEAAPMMAKTASDAADSAAGTMMAESADATALAMQQTTETSIIGYFLIGSLAVIIIYFIYEWVRKK